MRTTRRAAATTIAVGAVALRIPAYLGRAPRELDDGVYGASAVAMRTGALPFRQVFSSQGPLFLPLVWLFDLLVCGPSTPPACWRWPRAWPWCWPRGRPPGRCACRPFSAGLAAVLVATSGSVLWVTGP